MVTHPILTSLLLALFLLVPLVVKWQLGKVKTLPAIVLIGIGTGMIVPPITSTWTSSTAIILFIEVSFICAAAAALLLWRFFRDPERSCEAMERSILSAADGTVVYVKRFESGQIPVSDKHGRSYALEEFASTDLLPSAGYLIGIAMTYLDVHVNRAPIGGEVRLVKRIGGLYRSLKHKEAVFQNERVATVIENPDVQVGVVQIASRLVRKIVPFVYEQAVIEQGQRIGKIRFGSQVDIIVPDSTGLEILVAPGDRLTAGISQIARY